MIKFKFVVAKPETRMVTGIISMLLLAQGIEISDMPGDIHFKLQNIIPIYSAFRKYSDRFTFSTFCYVAACATIILKSF